MKIIEELEAFKTDVQLYYENRRTRTGNDIKIIRERISKKSYKIKKYLDDIGIKTDHGGRIGMGALSHRGNYITGMFENEGGLLAVPLKEVIDILNSAIGICESKKELNETEGLFDKGQYYDAQKFVIKLFKEATNSIYIVDNFINNDVFDLLKNKPASVKVEIITRKLSDSLKPVTKAFNKQYPKLSIYLSDIFHDRFIIIDEKTFCHLGASIKDLGNKIFMYSILEDEEIQKCVLDKITRESKKDIMVED